MDEKHRKILQRNWSTLRNELQPRRLFPYLENVLDLEDKEAIKEEATRRDASDMLLEILPRRGPKAFEDFVKALQEVQPYLAYPLVQQSGKNISRYKAGTTLLYLIFLMLRK